MSKYIDADALLAGIYSDNPSDIMFYVASQPEAIVRCEDCKLNDHNGCCRYDAPVNSEDYCSYGDRKEE